MVNEIITAIAKLLHENFPDFNVEIQPNEQGFEQPCFFISTRAGNPRRRIGGKRVLTYNDFQIAILSDDTLQLRSVADSVAILISLSPIETETDMFLTHDVELSVLSEQATVNFRIYRSLKLPTEDIPKMETFELTSEVL